MNITYTNKCDEVDWSDVCNLYKVIEWGDRSPEVVRAAFSKSSFVRFAYYESKLVGMGRTVDDGAFYAWVVDLAVLPELQGKGIGTRILKDLERDLGSFMTTMLTAAPGKNDFYEKLGWLKQTTAYIWPRTENQKRAFTGNA